MQESQSPSVPNAQAELNRHLAELLEPVVRSEGLLLVELQHRREPGGLVLRLYVDRPQGGVTLDECSGLSRQIGDLLDVEDLIKEPYNLEVSSPGLTRRLKNLREVEIFSGRKARLIYSDAQGKSRTLRGRLLGLDQSEEVLLRTADQNGEGKVVSIPWPQVIKANLDEA